MTSSYTPLITNVLLWMAVAYRFRRDLLRAAPTARNLCLALACAAGSQTVTLSGVSAFLQQTVGVATTVILHAICVIGASNWSLDLVRGLRGKHVNARASAGRAAVVVVLVAAPVLVSPPPFIPITISDKMELVQTSWFWVIYGAVMWTYLGCALVMVAYFCASYTRRTTGPLRTGVVLETVGACIGLAFVGVNLLTIVVGLSGQRTWLGEPDYDLAALLAAISLGTIGVGYGFEPAARRWAMLRSLHRLRPLWCELHSAMPHIGFLPATTASLIASPLNVQERLYRRVVEIRDGLLELRSYACPTVRDEALKTALRERFEPEHAEVLAEATWIRVALRARAQNAPATTTAAPEPDRGGTTFLEDVRWLERVSRAQTHPFVARQAHHKQLSRPKEVEVA